MKKKLFSIALIVVLISFTVAPLWGYSCISYGADSTTATDEQKQDAALSTYFNYRGGYFVASAGGAGVALQMARNLIDEFYNSSSNTTSIHSTSDFLAHVTFRNTNDHWGIYIDNNGVVFLDHLVKWLLGKDEFPNLYSGGAWGQVDSSTDQLYDGYINSSGSIFYIITDPAVSLSQIPANKVKAGNAVDGYTSEYIFDRFKSLNPNVDMYNNVSQSNTNLSLTVNYASDVSKTLNIFRGIGSSGVDSNYFPMLIASSPDGGGLFADRSWKVRGNPCWYVRSGYGSVYYYGTVTYFVHDNVYSFRQLGSFSRNDRSDINPTTVNFETEQFDRNDVGSESGTAPGVEFVPKEETETNTYNYYTYNDYSEKQFIENYIEDYVVKKTIIDGSSQDPGDNPGGGGGSDTPGTGSGNITPDGNGGFNFTMPDIGWPDFSGFDFNISGLSEKFPFSIPFDLMAFFTVLNAEPETPEIQGQIDLGIVQWDIDWNLEDFDGLASLLRNLEFIGFCLALILITRSIIKG